LTNHFVGTWSQRFCLLALPRSGGALSWLERTNMNSEVNPSIEPSKIDALARELDAAEAGVEETEQEAAVDTSGGVRFSDLGLDAVLIKALTDSGYTQPTTVDPCGHGWR